MSERSVLMKSITLKGKYVDGKNLLVSDEDYNWVSKYLWSVNKNGYAVRSVKTSDGKWSKLYAHREILNAPTGLFVDHIDGNKLNNQRDNLRLCTSKDNQRNSKSANGSSSKYKGVCWDKSRRKWLANITVDRKSIYIGRFKTEEEAALAYNEKAIELFGEFARLNIINENVS